MTNQEVQNINTDVVKVIEEQEDVMLNDIWSFYFHDPNDDNWTYASYKKVGDVTSVREFLCLNNMVKSILHFGMYFLFREYVFPCWDDENNIKGGCLSLRILKVDLNVLWKELCARILGETLLKEEHNNLQNWNLINGISVSPKKEFMILNIWVKSADVSDPSIFNIPCEYEGEIKYRSNQEKIDENHNKLNSS
jgi:hypothetical protein